jgi:hypothetical protein
MMMVKSLFFFILLCTASLWAERADPTARTFERRVPLQKEVYDFSGDYPELEKIDIDATRKMRVEVSMTGNYPLLERILYEGGFGTLNGKLTGHFPNLTTIEFLCGSCAMDFDLRGRWEKSCTLRFCGRDENIILKLPSDIGIRIHTKTGLEGKVIVEAPLTKEGFFAIWSKRYSNELAETASIVLDLEVITGKGHIILR